MFPVQHTDAFSGLETDETLNSAQIDQRARALLDQLNLDEKFSLMHGQQPFWQGEAAIMSPGGYSSRVWIAGEDMLEFPFCVRTPLCSGLAGRRALLELVRLKAQDKRR